MADTTTTPATVNSPSRDDKKEDPPSIPAPPPSDSSKAENSTPKAAGQSAQEAETNLFAIPWSPRTHAGIPPPTDANSPLAPPAAPSSSSAANSTTSTTSSASKRKASTPSRATAGDTPSRSSSADPTATGTASASKKRRTSSTGPDEKSAKMTERPRLSEQEKKNNHIASEQKRRLAIREGFDRLTEIVPGLEGQGRSESIVLKKSVDHMRLVLQERAELVQRIEALGGEVPPELKQV